MDIFITQHREIEGVIEEIRSCLNGGETARDARPTLRLLNNLISRLNNHIRLENERIYPWFAGSDVKALRDLGQAFGAEMEEILTECAAFFDKWEHVETIEEKTDSFSEDANMIFNTLIRRFRSEESELFPRLGGLADAATA